MSAATGKIVLMGSGELTPTMVPVHRAILRSFDAPRAVFLDTPAGFQLNVDQISERARGYFQTRLQVALEIASFQSVETTTPYEAEQALHRLRQADYVLVGPGSPSYAVSQWTQTRIPEILREIVSRGSCLVAASAASLTVGRLTLPVYEIYKVGEPPHWLDGLDLLAHFDLKLVVVPHWNNAEGGTHDTRFCYMGRPRFEQLERLVPEDHGVIGLDEHTACVLDLETQEARVEGLGSIALRFGGSEWVYPTGARFPLSVLRGRVEEPAASPMVGGEPQKESSPPPFWASVQGLEKAFHGALEDHEAQAAVAALLELDQTLWKALDSGEGSETLSQARELFGELLVVLGAHVQSLPRSDVECLSPLVEALLEQRETWRGEGRWAEADALRGVLDRAGIVVEDAPEGPRWHVGRSA